MFYIAKAQDRSGTGAKRAEFHPKHAAHLDRAIDNPRVVVSGPLLDQGDAPEGSFFIFEATSLKVVQDFLGQDPFAQEGIWASHEAQAFDWRRGKPAP
ncbi:YciI family protein [uncultured Tateyamaria sp.]|uniref:YciI family protein n=1 Tax=uncultured Tateyamaria sp. TaxID=455651 RepID=UPI00260A3372|nr:YciI family protein [uncultured Tateyamaria sp.]